MRTKNNSRPKQWDNNLKMCKQEVHRLDDITNCLTWDIQNLNDTIEDKNEMIEDLKCDVDKVE